VKLLATSFFKKKKRRRSSSSQQIVHNSIIWNRTWMTNRHGSGREGGLACHGQADQLELDGLAD